jgi:hypothetical protein
MDTVALIERRSCSAVGWRAKPANVRMNGWIYN